MTTEGTTGTGKLTTRLVERGLDVIAVDPIPEMLELLSNSLPDTPALLQRTCTAPNSAKARSASASTESQLAASVGTEITSVPARARMLGCQW